MHYPRLPAVSLASLSLAGNNTFFRGLLTRSSLLLAMLVPLSMNTFAATPQVAAGNTHTLALKTDGSLWAWGLNTSGQVGDGTGREIKVIKQIGTGFTTISTRYLRSLALKSDGSLWAWGPGPIGDGTSDTAYAPKQIGTGFSAISAGGNVLLAIKTDGSLWAWGNPYAGELGDGSQDRASVPRQIGTGFSAVAGGNDHSLALKTDGSLWAWGSNYYGQLGDGTNTTASTLKQIGTGFAKIAAGAGYSLAIKTDGSLWSWGANGRGQLGNDTVLSSNTPKQIGTGFTDLSAGDEHAFALKADGSLWGWGYNSSYYLRLGVSTAENSSYVPIQVGTGFTAAAAGKEQSVGIKSDGSLWMWGLSTGYYGAPQKILSSGFATTTPTDCFLNWVENQYPSLLSPSGTASVSSSPYTFRYYSTTKAYLAVSSADQHAYYLGPASGGSLLDIGPLSSWLTSASCPAN